jgi:hypothetical protein
VWDAVGVGEPPRKAFPEKQKELTPVIHTAKKYTVNAPRTTCFHLAGGEVSCVCPLALALGGGGSPHSASNSASEDFTRFRAESTLKSPIPNPAKYHGKNCGLAGENIGVAE